MEKKEEKEKDGRKKRQGKKKIGENKERMKSGYTKGKKDAGKYDK